MNCFYLLFLVAALLIALSSAGPYGESDENFLRESEDFLSVLHETVLSRSVTPIRLGKYESPQRRSE